VPVPIDLIGTFDTTLAKEFMVALAGSAGITLHVRALRQACEPDPRVSGIPSTKGSL